jgi:hypothetical protein
MLRNLTLFQKIKLLVIITFLKYGVMKLRKYVISIPLDNYKRDIFKQADWQFFNYAGQTGIKYKVAIDLSGQPRYLLYGIDTHCYRIEEKASMKEPEILPESVVLELEKNG